MQLTSFLTLPAKPLIGMEITNNCLRLALVEKKSSHYFLQRFAEIKLTEDFIEQTHIKNSELLVKTIKEAHAQLKTSIKSIAFALPDSAVIVKTISIDDLRLSALEFEEYIHHIAAEHIPFPMQEISLDFEILDSDPSSSKISLLLMGTRTQTVKNFNAIVSQAGLKLKIVDIQSFIISNVIKFIHPTIERAGVYIRVENTRLSFYYFNEKKLIFSCEEIFHIHSEDSVTKATCLGPYIQKNIEFYLSQYAEKLSIIWLSADKELWPLLTHKILETTGLIAQRLNLYNLINPSAFFESSNLLETDSLLLSIGLSLRAYS